MPKRVLIIIIILTQTLAFGCTGMNSAAVHRNEEAAIRLLGQLRVFQAEYASRNRGKFADFGELRKSLGYRVPDLVTTPAADGYVFTITVTEPSAASPGQYAINADPQVSTGPNITGIRRFYTDSMFAEIRTTRENRPASASDPSL